MKSLGLFKFSVFNTYVSSWTELQDRLHLRKECFSITDLDPWLWKWLCGGLTEYLYKEKTKWGNEVRKIKSKRNFAFYPLLELKCFSFVFLVRPHNVTCALARIVQWQRARNSNGWDGADRLPVVLCLHTEEEKGRKCVPSLLWVSWSNGFLTKQCQKV